VDPIKTAPNNQDRILAAYEQKSFEEARETARYFLKSMKQYLGTRLPPASTAQIRI
jgi:hypothetical protein